MTRDPKQNIHHLKALHASNPTVGQSSKLVTYELSYGHLNFHYSLVPLCYKQLKILNNQILEVDQKFFSKGVMDEWITSMLDSVCIVRSTHMLG